MFKSRLASVIPMDHQDLANSDGAEYGAGRGSGLQKRPGDGEKAQTNKWAIPYMQMTYAPIERRLDNAIFRALFASSVRQARQFVVHGFVKVNGKKVGALILICVFFFFFAIKHLTIHWCR
jgi:hypothetical protein